MRRLDDQYRYDSHARLVVLDRELYLEWRIQVQRIVQAYV